MKKAVAGENRNKKIITVCSSASFYRQVLEIKDKLNKLGFNVLIPKTAYKMRRTNNFDVSNWKTWYQNPKHYKIKAKLMMEHFKKVSASDAVLMINLDKNDRSGYIGPNGLIEMALAFYLNKPIFIYNQITKNDPFLEEIFGMQPIFINKDLTKISF